MSKQDQKNRDQENQGQEENSNQGSGSGQGNSDDQGAPGGSLVTEWVTLAVSAAIVLLLVGWSASSSSPRARSRRSSRSSPCQGRLVGRATPTIYRSTSPTGAV